MFADKSKLYCYKPEKNGSGLDAYPLKDDTVRMPSPDSLIQSIENPDTDLPPSSRFLSTTSRNFNIFTPSRVDKAKCTYVDIAAKGRKFLKDDAQKRYEEDKKERQKKREEATRMRLRVDESARRLAEESRLKFDEHGGQILLDIKNQVQAQLRREMVAEIREEVYNEYEEISSGFISQIRDETYVHLVDELEEVVKSELAFKHQDEVIKQLAKDLEKEVKQDLLTQHGEDIKQELRKTLTKEVRAELSAKHKEELRAELHAKYEEEVKAKLRAKHEPEIKTELRKTFEEEIKAELRLMHGKDAKEQLKDELTTSVGEEFREKYTEEVASDLKNGLAPPSQKELDIDPSTQCDNHINGGIEDATFQVGSKQYGNRANGDTDNEVFAQPDKQPSQYLDPGAISQYRPNQCGSQANEATIDPKLAQHEEQLSYHLDYFEGQAHGGLADQNFSQFGSQQPRYFVNFGQANGAANGLYPELNGYHLKRAHDDEDEDGQPNGRVNKKFRMSPSNEDEGKAIDLHNGSMSDGDEYGYGQGKLYYNGYGLGKGDDSDGSGQELGYESTGSDQEEDYECHGSGEDEDYVSDGRGQGEDYEAIGNGQEEDHDANENGQEDDHEYVGAGHIFSAFQENDDTEEVSLFQVDDDTVGIACPNINHFATSPQKTQFDNAQLILRTNTQDTAWFIDDSDSSEDKQSVEMDDATLVATTSIPVKQELGKGMVDEESLFIN